MMGEVIIDLFIMQPANKYRKSDCSIKQLSQLFGDPSQKKLRTTVGNSSMASLDFSSYRSTLSNQVNSRPSSNLPTFKKQSITLKDQLSSLQEKVNSAKQQMKLNISGVEKSFLKKEEESPTKVVSSTSISVESVGRDFREEEGGQEGLRRYTSAMIKPKNIHSLNSNPYITAKNSQYYLTQAIRAMHQKNSLVAEHIVTSISILKQCQLALKNGDPPMRKAAKIRIPKAFHKNCKKTLVLDLDETLIHCFQNSECKADLTLNIKIDGTEVEISFAIRPYALTFLKKMAKKWEIVIFTASHQNYANAILDEIDPDGVLIHHRLFRQHCSILKDMYVKDLSLINRDLKDMVLVDNAAYSYVLQLSNGIPILPFYDGKDYELSALESYLDKIYEAEDVRDVNREYFQLHRYTQFQSSKDLVSQIYLKNQLNLF